MVREGLLHSDRWLGLPDNTARVCFVACLLNGDDRGNMEASSGRLVRLWRDFGVDSTAKANSTLQLLCDCDLVRCYDVGSKRYIHIPRFRQRLRYIKNACPPSPWCNAVTKQQDSQKKDGPQTGESQTPVRLKTA